MQKFLKDTHLHKMTKKNLQNYSSMMEQYY